MAQAEVAQTPILGYGLAFAAGMLLAVLAGVGLLLTKPNVGNDMRLALGFEQEQLPVNRPTQASPYRDFQDRHLASNGNSTPADDALLEQFLSNGELTREADQQLLNNWAQQRFGNQNVQLHPLTGREEVLTVREFKTNTGKRIRVYTNLVPEDAQHTIY